MNILIKTFVVMALAISIISCSGQIPSSGGWPTLEQLHLKKSPTPTIDDILDDSIGAPPARHNDDTDEDERTN
jgi:hypothetical protein